MARARADSEVRPTTRVRAHVVAVGLYALLALWTTWPLARFAATSLPLGVEPVVTVPLFNAWAIWWNADRLAHGLRGYWDAPIFHPAKDTFALSEPQPTTMLVAPVVWLTGSRVLAYNVYLWLSLVLNGVFAERLMRQLGVGRAIAVGAGAAMLLLPIVHWQRDVLQLVPVWGVLWTWEALVKVTRGPSLARGGELGAALGLTCLTSVHQGLLLTPLLAGAGWVHWRWWLADRLLIALLAAGVVGAAVAGPVVAKLQSVAAKHALMRPADTVAALSAAPGDYVLAYGRPLLRTGEPETEPRRLLSPGWLKYGLAALGAMFGLTSRRWRRWTAFLLVTAGLAFLLSLGPNLHFGAWRPWWALTDVWPGFAQVRNVFRFAYFVQMAAVLLAAQGVHALCVLGRRLARAGAWRGAETALAVLLGLGAVIELRPTRPQLAAAPDAAANAAWIEVIREQSSRRAAIACLPFAESRDVRDQETTATWMYCGTFHGAPMVNGYSGFFPPEHSELGSAINASFPSERALRRLADAGVELLVVNRSTYSSDPIQQTPYGSYALDEVFTGSVGIDVYRLRRDDERSVEK